MIKRLSIILLVSLGSLLFFTVCTMEPVSVTVTEKSEPDITPIAHTIRYEISCPVDVYPIVLVTNETGGENMYDPTIIAPTPWTYTITKYTGDYVSIGVLKTGASDVTASIYIDNVLFMDTFLEPSVAYSNGIIWASASGYIP